MANETLTAKDILQNVADNVASKLQLDPKKFSDKLASILSKELSSKFTKNQLDQLLSNVTKNKNVTKEDSEDKNEVPTTRKSLLEKNKEVQKTEITNFKELQTILPIAFKESLHGVNDHLAEMSKVLKTFPALLKQISNANGGGGLIDAAGQLKDLISARKSTLLKKGATKAAETTGKTIATEVAEKGAVKAVEATGKTIATKAAETTGKTIATEVAEKGAVKAVEATGKTIATKAAETTGKTIATEVAEKGAVKAVEATGKTIATEVAEKGAVKAGTVLLEQGVESSVKAKIASSIAKRVPKAFGGVLAKSVPFLGAAIGAAFAVPRLLKGDYVGAALEAGSGVGSAVTAIPLTAALIAKDVYSEVYGVSPEKDPAVGNRLEDIKKSVLESANNFLSSKNITQPESSKVPEIIPEPVKQAIENKGTQNKQTESINPLIESGVNNEIKPPTPVTTIDKNSIKESKGLNSNIIENKDQIEPKINQTTIPEINRVQDKVDRKDVNSEVLTSKTVPPVQITPLNITSEPSNKSSISVPESNKTEGAESKTLQDIASNTGATNSILNSLVAGFNNLARALEKAGIATDQSPIIINKGTSASKTPPTQTAILGNKDISNFRSTYIEKPRFQPI